METNEENEKMAGVSQFSLFAKEDLSSAGGGHFSVKLEDKLLKLGGKLIKSGLL